MILSSMISFLQGGTLVIGANTLIYLNQSSPSVGIALNSLAEPHSAYQLRDPPTSLAISMDCSRSCFISPEQVVTSLRGGEIYILTLVPDGMRGIKNVLFEKTAAAVLASCVSWGVLEISVYRRLRGNFISPYTSVYMFYRHVCICDGHSLSLCSAW